MVLIALVALGGRAHFLPDRSPDASRLREMGAQEAAIKQCLKEIVKHVAIFLNEWNLSADYDIIL